MGNCAADSGHWRSHLTSAPECWQSRNRGMGPNRHERMAPRYACQKKNFSPGMPEHRDVCQRNRRRRYSHPNTRKPRVLGSRPRKHLILSSHGDEGSACRAWQGDNGTDCGRITGYSEIIPARSRLVRSVVLLNAARPISLKPISRAFSDHHPIQRDSSTRHEGAASETHDAQISALLEHVAFEFSPSSALLDGRSIWFLTRLSGRYAKSPGRSVKSVTSYGAAGKRTRRADKCGP